MLSASRERTPNGSTNSNAPVRGEKEHSRCAMSELAYRAYFGGIGPAGFGLRTRGVFAALKNGCRSQTAAHDLMLHAWVGPHTG